MAANEHQVILGALLLVVAAFASPAIALWLYPVLRERSKGGLALGSVGFRLIEGALYAVSVVVLLSLLTLSQEFVKAGASASSSFDTAGTVLKAARDWASLVGILAFYLGAFMYYYIFYKSRLVPRWLSVWGIVAVAIGRSSGSAGDVPCHRVYVDSPGCLQPSNRRAGNGSGGVADSQGIQYFGGDFRPGRARRGLCGMTGSSDPTRSGSGPEMRLLDPDR